VCAQLIKGRCAAACIVAEEARGCLGAAAYEDIRRLLTELSTQLGQTVQWVHRRELFLQMQQGTYHSCASVVEVNSLLKQLVASQFANDKVEISGDLSCTLSLDCAMLLLALEEGLSNALKFCAPAVTIQLHVALEEPSSPSTHNVKGDSSAFHIRISNQLSAGNSPLSEVECEEVFKRGVRKPAALAALSSGVGLATARQTARAAGGHAWLTMETRPLCAPSAAAAARPSPDELANGAVQHFATFHVRLPATAVETHAASPASTPVLPNEPTSEPASEPPTAKSCGGVTLKGLKVLAVDDDELMGLVLTSALQKLGADMAQSRVLGVNACEQGCIVDVALGRRDPALLEPCRGQPLPPADIVVLDQHIDCDGRQSKLGTDVAAELRQQGFDGLIMLHSASSPEEQDLTEHPAIDGTIAKGVPLTKFARDVLTAYDSRMNRQR